MRITWMWAALGVAVGGVALLLLQKKSDRQLLSFLPETEEERNFGAFPPEIPRYEFDGIDFV